jgi:hypothetical protein
MKADPLVDVMWKVFELTHSACFEEFNESYRMFHKYSQAIMDLWTKDISLRWFVWILIFKGITMHSISICKRQTDC